MAASEILAITQNPIELISTGKPLFVR